MIRNDFIVWIIYNIHTMNQNVINEAIKNNILKKSGFAFSNLSQIWTQFWIFVVPFASLFLYIYSPKGFNENLGLSLLLSLLLFSFVGTFVNFYSSVSSMAPGSGFNYQKLLYIFGGLIGFAVIPFGILTSLNVFKHSKPENYIDTIINYGTIMSLLAFAGLIYVFKKDPSNLSLNAKLLFEQRSKYAFLFGFYILSVVSLYAFNPQDIMNKYGGITIFFSLFIGIILFSMVTMYNYYFNNLSSVSLDKIPGWTFFLKSLYVLFSVGISGGLIYFLLKQMGVLDQGLEQPKEAGQWVKIIVNTLVLIGMLSIIYKLINIGGYLERSPLFNLIVNVVLYIPCILLSLFHTTAKNVQKTEPSEVGLLVLSLGLLASYFGLNYFYPKAKKMYNKWKLGGNQIVGNDALPLNKMSNIAGYEELNGNFGSNGRFNYTYGISFWFYLDSVPPNTNSSYNKIANILTYGDKPSVKYDSQNNSLHFYMTSKQPGKYSVAKSMVEETEDIQLIHKENDVMLQKWNNVIINYNGGTLDVFYNGKLVKSVHQIVPYMKYDMLTIGSENGIYGGIKNIMYYKEPIDSLTIQKIYSMQIRY
jgi:hypothetical protein